MKNEHRHGAGPNRRTILGGTSALAAAALVGTQAHGRRRGGGLGRPALVQVFLRGAMDGLTTVVPHGDDALYAARPTLAVPPPGQPNGAVDLDGFFGLAPAAAPLLTPYGNGHLAVLHACGSPDPTRSHFEAFVKMEWGTPNMPGAAIQDGWLARTLLATTSPTDARLRAASAGDQLPLSLAQAPNALPIADFTAFTFPGRSSTASTRVALLSHPYAYGGTVAPVGPAALDTFASLATISGIDFAGHLPSGGAQYPDTELGRKLRDVAALLKAGIGVEIVTIDVGGWDLHANLGPIDGEMAMLLDDLTRSIEAFYLDMLTNLDHYVLVVMSEFGRRVQQNSSLGLDHGHGNAMLVMGGGIQGGQVHAAWPGLAPANLDQGDLAVTTDYRDVLGEILERRLGLPDAGVVFPGHAFTTIGITT